MRCGLIVLGLSALSIAACSRSSPTPVAGVTFNDNPAPPAQLSTAPGPAGQRRTPTTGTASLPPPAAMNGARDPAVNMPPPITDPDERARFDAALATAAERMAEKKWDEALAAVEAARSIQTNNELIDSTVARLRSRREQEISAEQTANNIQTVLDEGKPEDAARLAAEALLQFGNTDA